MNLRTLYPIMTYPRVQYKIIGGTPSILGIEEGADILRKIAGDIDDFTLLGSRYRVENRVIHEQITPFGPVKDPVQYRFHTPWAALNTKNYGAYRALSDWKEKKEFLNRILVGNILSMAKGLGMVVDHRIYTHSRVDEERIRFKGVEMTGFTGEFRVNFAMPDYMGIGKGTSQGFGTVRAVQRGTPDEGARTRENE